jgi:hypothetical protein
MGCEEASPRLYPWRAMSRVPACFGTLACTVVFPPSEAPQFSMDARRLSIASYVWEREAADRLLAF